MQIIYAHRKSFDADQYAAIKYNFSSFERNKATVCSIFLFKFLIWLFDCFGCFESYGHFENILCWALLVCFPNYLNKSCNSFFNSFIFVSLKYLPRTYLSE